jgi:serine phosphatase RsbU (regulator of sigma subunit)
MASVKNALRASMIMDPDIVRTLDAVDYMLRVDQHEPGLFCTALLGIVDPEAMTLRLAPAGHPGPKIWDFDKNAVVDPFSDRDLPLGLRDMSTRRTQPKTIRLEGGLVVFFTDGLLESTRDYVAGEQALERVISRRQVRDAADPARSIVNAMQCANADDDVAILVLRPATIPRRPLL